MPDDQEGKTNTKYFTGSNLTLHKRVLKILTLTQHCCFDQQWFQNNYLQ